MPAPRHAALLLACLLPAVAPARAATDEAAPAAAPAAAAAAAAAADSFDARFQAARTLALSGERERALAAYDALLAESPGNSDVLLGRGRLHGWMGHWAQAEADLAAATRASPRYADAWSALGDLYLWNDRPALAADAYGQWLALASADDAAPLLARGRAWRALGDRDAARADFESARARGADAATVDALVDSLVVPDARRYPEEPVAAGNLRWTGSLGIDHAMYSGGGPAFTDVSAMVRGRWAPGSLGFEALSTHRFGSSDQAFALDGYVGLWQKAYANLRWQVAPSAVLYPRQRWRAELFQGVGHGWELSAGYDRLGFGEPVELLSVGVGRYVGNWYLRWRHLHVPGTTSDPASSDSDRLVGRWYYGGDAERYAEFSASGGSSEPSATVAPGRAVRHSWSVGGAWALPLGRRLGLRVGASTGYGSESQPYRDTDLSATVYTRW